MIQAFRSKNIHYHGIIHAFGMTILVILQNEYLMTYLTRNAVDSNIFTAIHTGIPALYLAFAMWHYCLASGKNTILSNLGVSQNVAFKKNVKY